MYLELVMPRLGDPKTPGVITRCFIAVGATVVPGQKLFEVMVDLSAVAPQDCPPVSHFHVVSNEKATVVSMNVQEGVPIAAGVALATLCTAPDEPPGGAPARRLRVSHVGILTELDW